MKPLKIQAVMTGILVLLAGLSDARAIGSEMMPAQGMTAFGQLEIAAGQPASYAGARAGFGEASNPGEEAALSRPTIQKKAPTNLAADPLAPKGAYKENNLVADGRKIGSGVGIAAGIAGGAVLGWKSAAALSSSVFLKIIGAAAIALVGGWVGMIIFGAIGMALGMGVAVARGEALPD